MYHNSVHAEGDRSLHVQRLLEFEASETLGRARKIGIRAFAKIGIERIVLPSSTRVVSGGAFADCERLRSVTLNEGLEALGAKENLLGKIFNGEVFMNNALESITIPSTLKEIDSDTFKGCESIERIKFLGGIRVLEEGKGDTGFWKNVLQDYNVEEIVLPNTLHKASSTASDDGKDHKTVCTTEDIDAKALELIGCIADVLKQEWQRKAATAQRPDCPDMILRVIRLLALAIFFFSLGARFASNSSS